MRRAFVCLLMIALLGPSLLAAPQHPPPLPPLLPPPPPQPSHWTTANTAHLVKFAAIGGAAGAAAGWFVWTTSCPGPGCPRRKSTAIAGAAAGCALAAIFISAFSAPDSSVSHPSNVPSAGVPAGWTLSVSHARRTVVLRMRF